MRKLLLFFIVCLTSLGASAYTIDTTKKWQGDGGPASNENVGKISLEQAGELATAIAALNAEFAQKPAGPNGTDNQYQVLYISNGAGFDLTDEDIAALGTVTCATLDLQNLYGSDGGHHAPFTFSNASIKRVILPDYWDKTAVKAAAQAIASGNTGFEAALSQHGNPNQSTADAKLVAYLNKPNTLYTAMRHTYFDGRADNKMGTMSGTSLCSDKLGYVAIMGNICARDISTGASTTPIAVKYDANGHFVFDKEADETSIQYGAAVGGGTRAMIGNTMVGALARNSTGDLIQLDLGDAIIDDQWNADLTLSMCGIIGNNTKEIIFPTCPQLKTIPADCLNYSLPLLEEICIPGNIENLKTRSFWISNQVLRHIWTTGTTEHMRYDNGAYLHDDHENPDHYGHAPLDDTRWNCGNGTKNPARYGTITLPENLKLIESHVFTARSVSDVYVLAKVAPECHVDAFSTIMYMGNNTIDTQYTNNQGMITRWSYAQGDADAEYIAFLHYPRECGTPEIQRYTDPTREYSVATTWRDGKGNVVYFPNQSEFNRAYMQGTTGYLWYAWDSERIPDMGNNGDANSFKNVNPSISTGASTETQQQANTYYEQNTMTDPDKTDRSFYDVRLDQYGQPTLTKPADLKWYYNTVWEGKQLYPEMEYTNTTEYIGQQQKMDAQGHLLYVEGNCDFVQDYEYVKNTAGNYYWDLTVTPNENGNSVQDYEYVAAQNGTYYHPMEQETGNKDQTLPSKYWYFATTGTYSLNPNGDYIFVNNSYTLIANAKSWWGWTDEQIAQYDRYSADGSWTKVTEINNTFWQVTLYYVGDNYALYSSSVTDFITGVNNTLYNKVYKDNTYRAYDSSKDSADEPRYDVTDNGIREYNSATDTDDSKRYNKVYKEFTYRAFDSSKDDANEQRYCPDMEDVYQIVKGDTKDYRGWHQFVLHAYDTNDDRPLEPIKFYQTDDDWWTICLPYDLTYTEMKQFFGDETKLPYLSKLQYVVRDYDQKRITLMFSNNLMEYKEQITNPSNTDDFVHGTIDNTTKYTADELADDPIILHKGVPYLIRPSIAAGRSFDVFKTENEDLYNRLVDSHNVPAAQLETYIYKGEYTVPAYVVGGNGEEATQDSRSFNHAAGPTMTYTSGTITYNGAEVEAEVSSEFSYTFVGSYFLSVLPQYCYFLGWDSKSNRAAFWYNRVPDLSSYDWNNQTGIICPNFNTSLTIDPATSLSDPARWIFGASDIANDDLKGGGSGANSITTMTFGGSVPMQTTGIQEMTTLPTAKADHGVVYNINGQVVRTDGSLQGLSKGIYIVNGKKYVVK